MQRLARNAVFFLLGIALFGCREQNPKRAKGDTHPQMRLSTVQPFDLRAECQAIVDKDVQKHRMGAVGNTLVSRTTSYYNPVTNRCYAESIATRKVTVKWPATPSNYLTDALYDAQTRELLILAIEVGDTRIGQDFTSGRVSYTTYEEAIVRIQALMTQE